MSEHKKHQKKRIIYILIFFVLILFAFFLVKFQDFFLDHFQYGYISIFLSCFIANATVLFPAPSTGIVLSFSLIYPPVIVAILGGTGAALGELAGYVVGVTGAKAIDTPVNPKFLKYVERNDILTIGIFSFLPLPFFDVIGIASGYLQIKPLRFFMPCLIGKLLKMSLYAFVGTELSKWAIQ